MPTEVTIKAASNAEFKQQLRDGLMKAGYDASTAHIAADLSVHAATNAIASIPDVVSRMGDASLQLQLLPTILRLLAHLAAERAEEAEAVNAIAHLEDESDEEMAAKLAAALGRDPAEVLAEYREFEASRRG